MSNARAEVRKEWNPRVRRRAEKRLQVKIGHGGTLDPHATGVLILGIGTGTKKLSDFLNCTKSYEATMIFGVATDSYDILGNVTSTGPYAHVTREVVAKALESFRGSIMQKPPIYSAIRVQGKHLYEYARQGKEVPVEIQERPMTVSELEMMEWLPPGSHSYKWPSGQAESERKLVAEKVLNIEEETPSKSFVKSLIHNGDGVVGSPNKKRARLEQNDEEDDLVTDNRPPSKRRKEEYDHLMSGALPAPKEAQEPEPADTTATSAPAAVSSPSSSPSLPPQPPLETPTGPDGPPAVKLRMTVTSGFYVRSLCHDLALAVGSKGIMTDLIRTRQGKFRLGANVLDYDDVSKEDESVWAPKLESMLRDWQANPRFSEDNDEGSS